MGGFQIKVIFWVTRNIFATSRQLPKKIDGTLRGEGVLSLLQGAGIRMFILHPIKARVCRAMKITKLLYIARKIKHNVTLGICVDRVLIMMDLGLSCSGEI